MSTAVERAQASCDKAAERHHIALINLEILARKWNEKTQALRVAIAAEKEGSR